MSTIVVGECKTGNLYELWDADAALEGEFEHVVAKALVCVYPNYICFPFAGSFKLDDDISKPDLALVAKDLSHWFIIEVELVSHSLDRHVLPQIRCFQYGTPQEDCISILARELSKTPEQIHTFLRVVPRTVAVIANKRNRDWEIAFNSLQVQMLTVSAFNSPNGIQAVEIDGRLFAKKEHLGFGQYFAVDRALRFHRTVMLPEGEIMLDDPSGAGGMWIVARDANHTWVTKGTGTPDIPNEAFVQLVRAFDGRLSLRKND